MLDVFPHEIPQEVDIETRANKVIKIIHCNTEDINYIIKILDLAIEHEAQTDKEYPSFTIFTDVGRVLNELKEIGYPKKCTYKGLNLTLEMII